jgi:hypothetical protein
LRSSARAALASRASRKTTLIAASAVVDFSSLVAILINRLETNSRLRRM